MTRYCKPGWKTHPLKKKASGWKGFVFTGNLDLAKEVGLKASRRFPLFNGAIDCRLLTYDLYAGSRESVSPLNR